MTCGVWHLICNTWCAIRGASVVCNGQNLSDAFFSNMLNKHSSAYMPLNLYHMCLDQEPDATWKLRVAWDDKTGALHAV